jgi:hypothetical protein
VVRQSVYPSPSLVSPSTYCHRLFRSVASGASMMYSLIVCHSLLRPLCLMRKTWFSHLMHVMVGGSSITRHLLSSHSVHVSMLCPRLFRISLPGHLCLSHSLSARFGSPSSITLCAMQVCPCIFSTQIWVCIPFGSPPCVRIIVLNICIKQGV